MRQIYNIFYGLGLAISSPFLLFGIWRKGLSTEGFRQRFGRYTPNLKQALTNRHVLWVHIASAEHVSEAVRFLDALQDRLPNAKIVASVRTAPAMECLRREAPAHISKVYLPLDRRPWVARALSATNPKALILVGPDLWPNFLWRARYRGTPIFLLATHLSTSSRRMVGRWHSLLGKVWRDLEGAAAGTDDDAKLLRSLGCPSQRLRVTGDIRFDNSFPDSDPAAARESKSRLGVPSGANLLFASSVSAREANALARLILPRAKAAPALVLALSISPTENGRQITRELRRSGLRYMYRSEVPPGEDTVPSVDCWILDQPAEISRWAEACDVVFLGDTLCGSAGQNPLPFAGVKPVVFGPTMGEFTEVARQLSSQGAAARAASASDLTKILRRLLSDEPARLQMVNKARELSRGSMGATSRCVELVVENLDDSLYVRKNAPAASDG